MQMVCPGILSGCIYGILLKTTKCIVFFFLFLFKANGSESEQSAVTEVEIHDDLENTQMKKGCFCQPFPVAWQFTPTGFRMPHPDVSILQELENLLMSNQRNWGAEPGLGPIKVMDPQRWDLGKG